MFRFEDLYLFQKSIVYRSRLLFSIHIILKFSFEIAIQILKNYRHSSVSLKVQTFKFAKNISVLKTDITKVTTQQIRLEFW